MEPDELAQDIADQMFLRGYTWKIGGEQKIPSAEDVQETLDKIRETLYASEVPSQMHVGRLIVHHWKQDHFDVYLQIGQIS